MHEFRAPEETVCDSYWAYFLHGNFIFTYVTGTSSVFYLVHMKDKDVTTVSDLKQDNRVRKEGGRRDTKKIKDRNVQSNNSLLNFNKTFP